MMTASSIAAMLAGKGQTVSIAGTSTATYDTANGSASGSAYAASGSAVPLPLNAYKHRNNSNVKAGDEQMLLSALVDEPPLGAIVTLADGTTKYTLIAVEPLHPAGSELLWDCVVRR